MRGTPDCEPHSRFQPTVSGKLLLGLIPVFLSACATPPPQSPSSTTSSTTGPVLKSEFIYESAPFPSCHASTIAETKGGLIAAWFGGTDERNPDVGIWISRHNGTDWSAPVEVANGVQDDGVKRPADTLSENYFFTSPVLCSDHTPKTARP